MILKKIENNYDLKIKKIRCDNAGENISLEKQCINQKMKIKFEYTSPGTPQQNGRIERKFATLYGRVRAMFISAGIEGELRKRLWAEAANTAAMVDNVTLNQGATRSAYEIFSGANELPKYALDLRIFGEIGIVINKKDQMKSKILNRGKKAMMVGYHTQSASGVYRMYNFETRKIIQTRNVRWTDQKYVDYKSKDEWGSDSSDDEEKDNEYKKKIDDDEAETKAKFNEAATKRLESALKKLHTFYNPTEVGSLGLNEDYCFVGGTDEEYINPMSFGEAWDHENEQEREHWRNAIKKEFSDMIRRGVWKHTKKQQIPSDRRLIGNKWVFKRKKNGVYRARLVGLGYSQVPGIDHKDNFSPVINEVTFRCVMVLMLQNNWVGEIVDVVTAFLYGDLDELIFMKIPEGLNTYSNKVFNDEDCVVLEKSIYGLVQAARQFHRKLISKMTKDMGFNKCLSDECLLFRSTEDGMVIVCVYIDDTLCVGDEKAVKKFKNEIKEHFETKEEGKMNEYVGCKVKCTNEKSIIMYQDDLIHKIEKTFGDLVSNMQVYDMPAGTGARITRSKEGLISKKEQTLYRSGVGMLLFLVKYSRPDLANIVRELSRVNDGATKAHMVMLYRVIKFTIDTKNRVLEYNLKDTTNEWVLKAFCDSDWAGNKDNRRSITGYCIYLQGCLIAWKSRAQKM